MELLELPAELLILIIKATIPDVFENFMLSCKTIHQNGQEFITEYKSMRSKYSSVSMDAANLPSIYYWLNKLYQNPSIACWMRTVNLAVSDGSRESNGWSLASSLVRDNVRRNVLELIKSTRYVPVELKKGAIRTPEALGAIVLASLTNVTDLVLPWCPFWNACNLIVQKNMSGNWHAPLMNLRCLRLYLQDCPFQDCKCLDAISPLFGLPQLEELCAYGLVALEKSMVPHSSSFLWPYHAVNSNLRCIELANCHLDSLEVSDLLSRTPNLTSFKYEFMAGRSHNVPQRKDGDGLGNFWNVGEFVAAIEKYVGNQLHHLAITVGQSADLHGLETAVTSMAGFTILETLEVDWAIFFGPSIEAGTKGMWPGRDSWTQPPRVGGWTPKDIPPARKILPKTLREFSLFIDTGRYRGYDYCTFPFFEGMYNADRTLQCEDLPQLKRCYVRQPDRSSCAINHFRDPHLTPKKPLDLPNYCFDYKTMPRWGARFEYRMMSDLRRGDYPTRKAVQAMF
ncbi:hypothetical protein F5Y16DRAFT_380959 [Xylariaceae sp. FL0255]|nr:hypothetical protein F5Y16DRAFT_380959 [Xylariaceae sp. FL0255]